MPRWERWRTRCRDSVVSWWTARATTSSRAPPGMRIRDREFFCDTPNLYFERMRLLFSLSLSLSLARLFAIYVYICVIFYSIVRKFSFCYDVHTISLSYWMFVYVDVRRLVCLRAQCQCIYCVCWDHITREKLYANKITISCYVCYTIYIGILRKRQGRIDCTLQPNNTVDIGSIDFSVFQNAQYI